MNIDENTPTTVRQDQVLAAMREMTTRDGMPPTLRELADALGVASTYTVVCHLRSLAARGLVKRRAGCARGWGIA